jgi:hypothetical protein
MGQIMDSSASPSYGNAYAPKRPAPQTWQESDQYGADDAWNAQGQRVQQGQDDAAGDKKRSQDAADSAADMASNYRATNTENYHPGAISGYQPSAVANWMASMPKYQSGAGGAGGVVGSMGESSGSFSVDGGKSNALRGFSAQALTDFDPSSYGKEFAKGAGAQNDFTLGQELDTLQNRAVGAGRLRTGLFDRDQGRTIQNVRGDLNSKIAQQAGVFSGQRLSALQGGTQLEYERAAGIERNSLEASGQYNSLTQSREANALRATEDANNFAAENWRSGIGAAESADRLGFERATGIDDRNWGRAQSLDASGRTNVQTGLDAALSRERLNYGAYDTANERSDSYTSSSREWAHKQRQEQDARDLVKRRTGAPGGGGAGGGSTAPDPYSVNRKLAASYGVPFVG